MSESAGLVSLAERANRWYWEDVATVHARERMPERDAVLAGGSSLRSLELRAVGDPAGKRVLHLLCHLGFDSISWAKLGASVTAVDFSEVALRLAAVTAAECGQHVQFVQAKVPDLPHAWSKAFDVVAMTYGTVAWLPDIFEWAKACARCLVPNGRLVLIDDHPDAEFARTDNAGVWHSAPPNSLASSAAVRYRAAGTYLNRDARLRTPVHYRWRHSVESISVALSKAGFEAIDVRHHYFAHYRRFPQLQLKADGYYRSELPPPHPLLLEVRAVRAA